MRLRSGGRCTPETLELIVAKGQQELRGDCSRAACRTGSWGCSRRAPTCSPRPPAGFFPLGTDHAGRDLLSRLLHGARVSLTVGLVGAAITLVMGLLIGGAAGYFGGAVPTTC